MSEQQPTAPVAKPRFRDRVWTLPVLVSVAVVALVLGAGIGVGLASLGGDDGHDGHDGYGRHGRFGPGPMTGQFRPGGPMMHPGRGQLRRFDKQWTREFRQFQRFRQWERSHPLPSPSASPQG